MLLGEYLAQETLEMSSGGSSGIDGGQTTVDTRIRARFVTKFEEYRVTDVAISVPAKLTRSGLSEVIHHLLGNETIGDDNRDFDFKINNGLLRESLGIFLHKLGISQEETIEIEYFPLASFSGGQRSSDQQAWVGCIDASLEGRIVTGCYDGTIKLNDSESLSLLSSTVAHNSHPVRAIRACGSMVLTGSKDHTVKCFSFSPGRKDLTEVGTLVGHLNSVESVDFESSHGLALSGEWSGHVFGWDIKPCFLSKTLNIDTNGGPHRKRKKGSHGLAEEAQITINPAFTMRAHAQVVSGLQIVYSTNRLFTCSYDHTVKMWDLERQDCIRSD